MKKIKIYNYYRNCCVITEGDTLYGNYLSYPGNYLFSLLKEKDFVYTDKEDCDIALFFDLDEELFKKAKSLPARCKKILILVESPIYTPYPHHPNILFNPVWDIVFTYNRELYSTKFIYYDIPVTGTQCPIASLTPLSNVLGKGVFVGSYKNDVRGYTAQRDKLIIDLAKNDEIDIYGANWPNVKNYCGKTSDKIQTCSRYKYVLACENAKYSGYVTEKIGDAILAERPSIYFGDQDNALRRFGETFIPIDSLTMEKFCDAKKQILQNYGHLHENCLKEKQNSYIWLESYVSQLFEYITKYCV